MDTDRYEQGPFEELYEQWFTTRPESERDPKGEAQLLATYRSAFESGLEGEQVAALYFIWRRKVVEGAGLLVEALRSDSPFVAGAGATLVSVTHGRSFEFGPELRPAFRALVRRFPINSVVRPRALYGHEPGDADDTAARPFVNLYEDWRVDDFPGNPVLAERLIDTHRSAWADGDSIERAFVLLFLPGPGDVSRGADLVRESLRTHDLALAQVAAFTANFFLERGINPGPRTRELIESLRERFGDRAVGHAWSALRALDKLDGVSRDD
jgi:hypothetical protein